MKIPKFHAFFEYILNGDKSLCKVSSEINDFEHELLVRSPEIFELLIECVPRLSDSDLKVRCQALIDDVKAYYVR